MSHQPERKEKDCLNCGAEVLGHYCQNCGQQNILVHQSFWQLVTHFIYDVFHFDGKFFDTLRYLLFKPGFVPKEYVRGRRLSYLDPIRMYLFTSALFFLVFFSMKDADKGFINMGDANNPLNAEERAEAIVDIKKDLAKKPNDTTLLQLLNRLEDTTQVVREQELYLVDDNTTFVGNGIPGVKTLQQYDSLQKAAPENKKDGWLEQLFARRMLVLNAKYGAQPKEGVQHFASLFIHKLPYLLFASLPFFALILKLLYVRRKPFYYSDHAVFTLYHYILSFILLLLTILFAKLSNWTHVKLFQNLNAFLFIGWTVYLYIAMKRFYGQDHFKTFSKFLLLNLLGIIVVLLLFLIFVFFTFFQL